MCMLTRSSEWIFSPMRYAGIIYIWMHNWLIASIISSIYIDNNTGIYIFIASEKKMPKASSRRAPEAPSAPSAVYFCNDQFFLQIFCFSMSQFVKKNQHIQSIYKLTKIFRQFVN